MSLQEEPFNRFYIDEKIFESLFKENFVSLCAFCQYRFDLGAEQSEDIVNTAFLKLWESRATFPNSESVKSYLYRILNNSCLDKIRHDKVKSKYQEFLHRSFVEDAGPRFEEMDIKQLAARIHQIIHDMPDQMRKIFEMSRFEELKYTEISERLHISVKTVETQMSRALARLRKGLQGYLFLFFTFLLPWK